MSVQALLKQLSERLPELEWKINTLKKSSIHRKSLPKGVFRERLEMTGATCIAEIKADIASLHIQQNNERSAYYLAQKIQQKINILVMLCHIKSGKSNPEEKIHFGVKMMSTRQQWLQDLEQTINQLTQQQQALTLNYQQLQKKGDTDSLLRLQAELGAVEKRLTVAKETYNGA